MVTNGGHTEDLFRGAIMNAGSPIPTGDITNQQPYYNTVVEHAGCANATDTIDCLRHVPTDTLVAAAGTIPNLFEYPVSSQNLWAPDNKADHTHAPGSRVCLGSTRGWSISARTSSTSRPFRECRQDPNSYGYASSVSLTACRIR